MPETKRPLKVFLCHASADKPKVRELYRYLRRRGIKPWFDEVDLVGGQDWQVEIPKALTTSDAIIICLTKNSVDKEGYIQKEIKFALDKALEMPEGRIFLIPVRFEECEVPFSLSRYQWVDLFDEVGYARMMRALKFRAAQLERATVQLPKKDIEEDKLALEKAKREKEEHEATEKAAHNKAEKDVQKKARLETEERARQKAASEKEERDTAEKAAQEKIGKEIQREVEKRIKKAKRDLRWERFKINFRYRLDLIRIYRVPILILSVGLAIIIPLSVDLYNRFPELTQALNNVPTITLTTHLITPSQTLVPGQTRTKFPTLTLTPTKTKIPTLTPTFTPIPRSSILFQRDFEGGVVSEWSHKGGIWVIEQEPDGNDYLSGSSSEANPNPSQIQYTYQKTRWTDYALETRVKFVTGRTLYILIRSDVGSGEFYGIAINDSGFSFMRTWSMIGKNIPMTLAPNRWYTIRVEIKGDLLSAYIDDALFQELKLQPPLIDHGGIGFVIDGDKVYFDDIKAWSLK